METLALAGDFDLDNFLGEGCLFKSFAYLESFFNWTLESLFLTPASAWSYYSILIGTLSRFYC